MSDWAVGPRFGSECYDNKGEIATLRTTDMDIEGNINLSTMPRAHLPNPLFKSHFLEVDDLVISRSGTIGITGLFQGHWQPVLPGAFLLRFRLNDDLLPQFCRYYMNSPEGARRVQQLAAGGVQKNIRGTALLPMRIPVPAPGEQRRIAEILDTADEAIQKTEALIAKLKQMKAGLLHDLLTRGIDENGDLRPLSALTKATKFGMFPESWDLVPLQDIQTMVTSGSRGWAQYYSETGSAMFLRIGNLTREHINL